MKNYKKINVANDARTELHDSLQLTGAEISVNNLPAGASVPFVHYHKKNEEIY
ncbi:MAG TPA: cupin domain-containing protein, partial [Anaerovibrio sp.]|nr:cupin domain-containing protein [Anaerovibrio sp.]